MIKLTSPRLAPDYIDHHITCVRPKRQGGARIEHELVDDKFIIHNYGHGGFGWSLLPGSVQHSLSILQKAIEQSQLLVTSKKVTVIGAGCFGLLTALLLKQQDWDVTIIAENTEGLTSHKAAGSLAAIAIKASRDNQELMDKASVDSYVFYKNLITQTMPTFEGVSPMPVYMIHEGTPNYRYPLIAAGVMPSPEEVIVDFGNNVTYKAKKFETFFLDTIVIMNDLMSKIITHDIPVIKKKIQTFTEIDSTIIFNCAGLGARVWDNRNIVPVQGHLVKLKNQPIDALNYILYAHIKIDGKLREIAWVPREGGLLGASVVNGEERLEANPELADAIIKYARIFFGGR